MASIAERVRSQIAERLGVKPEQVVPEVSLIDDLGADSLDAVELVMAIRETRGNKRAASAKLGIDYKTLFNKLKAFGIAREVVEAMKE